MNRLFITALACLISLSVFGQNQQSIIISENQWIEIPAWQPPGSFTLSAWVLFPLPNASEGDWHTLFSNENGGDHHVLFHDAGQLGIYNDHNFVGCGFSANELENGYHYISAIAYDNSTDFYVNGEFVGTSGGKVSGIMHTIGNISIPPFGGNQPIGQIDDVSIWDYAQDASLINQFMNCPPNGTEFGLISHYNFESSSLDIVNDLSSYNFHGNIVGNPIFSSYTPENNCESDFDDSNVQNFCGQGTVWDEDSGQCVSACPELIANNYSMNFDGINDFIQIQNSSSLNFSDSKFSVLFWAKVPDLSASSMPNPQRVAIEKGWNFELVDSDVSGDPQFEVEGLCNYEEQNSLQINEWTHIAGTFDGNTVSLYINGELMGVNSDCGNLNNVETDLFFGNHSELDRWFKGDLDDIQIWSYKMEIEDINTYMNCPPIGNEAELSGFWNFEELVNGLVYDLSENENHGVVEGATLSVSTPYDAIACWSESSIGNNYCGSGTIWDNTTQTCISESDPTYPDNNGDNCVDINDLLNLLIYFGSCE